MPPPIPWADIETLFLDVGNTLMSVDFDRIARELGSHGLACGPQELRRAEAAARPALSRWLADRSTEDRDGFQTWLRGALRGLAAAADHDDAGLDAIVAALAPSLRVHGESHRLWCWVLPGVPEALAALRETGLELVVVSNSDGTVERGLAEQGLRDFFSDVHDSHLVGWEKPDRRIFDHALERAGTRPERTLHVGDLYAADVVGARAAGIHPLLLDPFDDWGQVDCERLPDVGALARRLAEARTGGGW